MNLSVLDISYKWNQEHLSFCVWLNSLMVSILIYVIVWHVSPMFTPFYDWIIFYCMYIPQFTHSSVNVHFIVSTYWLLWIVLQWTLTTHICLISLFRFFRTYITRSGMPGLHGNSIFNFLRNCQIVFHSSQAIFTCPPAIYKGSNFSIFSTWLISLQ